MDISSLSPQAAKSFIDAALMPGKVLHLYIPNFGKNKFVLILNTQPLIGVFFINSRIAPFISNRPELLSGQVEVLKSDLPFLDHDSWIDCSKITYNLDSVSVRAQIINDYQSTVKSPIPDSLRQTIVQVTSQQTTLNKAEKDLIKDNLLDPANLPPTTP